MCVSQAEGSQPTHTHGLIRSILISLPAAFPPALDWSISVISHTCTERGWTVRSVTPGRKYSYQYHSDQMHTTVPAVPNTAYFYNYCQITDDEHFKQSVLTHITHTTGLLDYSVMLLGTLFKIKLFTLNEIEDDFAAIDKKWNFLFPFLCALPNSKLNSYVFMLCDKIMTFPYFICWHIHLNIEWLISSH